MKKIALIRGKFLTRYDMEPFELLTSKYDITAFASKTPFSDSFNFPTIKLWSPMDLPDFPYKMQTLNRLFIDAHFLLGLGEKLRGFDIVHTSETYFHYTNQALNAKKKGYVNKVVINVLENIAFNNEGIWGRKNFKKRAINEADYFIAGSNKSKAALLAEGVPEHKISVVGLGINTKIFYPRKIKNSSRNINILFAGRIEEYKGVFDTVKAFETVFKDFPRYNLTLTIVGRGSKEKKLKELILRLGLDAKIIYKNASYEGMAEEYQNADIFLGPSKEDRYWQEQFGMVFAESLASGLPVITTDTGSIKETVGDAAIVVKPGSISEISAALKSLIKNPHKRLELGARGRERAQKVLSIDIVARKIDEIYQKL